VTLNWDACALQSTQTHTRVCGFAGTGTTFSYPREKTRWVENQTRTRTRTHGYKLTSKPAPYRVFTRGHAGKMCPLPSLSLMSLGCTSFGSPAKSHRYSPCRARSTTTISRTMASSWHHRWRRGGPTAMITRHCRGSFYVCLLLILFANTYTCFFV
jgi:hypothetical protein